MMVWIRKGVKDGITFYELRHNVKIDGKVKVLSKYLGRQVPENADEIRKGFIQDVDSYVLQRTFSRLKGTQEIVKPSTGAKKGVPAKPSFGIYFTFVSQRMSGCSLTMLEAVRLLEHGRTRWEKPAADNIETRAHYELYRYMLAQERDLSVETINDWHWKMFRSTKPSMAGVCRNSDAKTSFGEYTYPDPGDISSMLQELFSWYENARSLHPVMLAGIVHSRLLMIHPFAAGNGRIARLALNFVLHRNGYPMYGFNERQVERLGYYNSLKRSINESDHREMDKWFYRQYRRNYLGSRG